MVITLTMQPMCCTRKTGGVDTQPDNSGRARQVFGVMLGLGVAVTLLSVFYSSSPLLVVGLSLALIGCLGSLSTR
jgi:hypothetical protein